jgi:hypothetical protein
MQQSSLDNGCKVPQKGKGIKKISIYEAKDCHFIKLLPENPWPEMGTLSP